MTDAEYHTLLAVLSFPEATEQTRIRWSELPSSTYNVAKRRVYQNGWVADHWLPNPGPLGFSGIAATVLRPFAAERSQLEERLSADPRCVLAWSGVHFVFAVHFLREPDDEEVSPPSAGASGSRMIVRPRRGEGSCPVYFDYSGLWARFGREPIPPEYPRGLDLESPEATGRERTAAERAVISGTAPGGEETSHRWANLLRLPRSQREAVASGLVAARCVPNLAALPPRDGRRIGEVVLVFGRSRRDGSSARLLNALTKDCAVFPLFFAEADGRVLFLGVGQTSARGPGRMPVRSARRSVMGTINEHLEHVEVLVEPVESLREVVGHRYAELLERSPASTNGAGPRAAAAAVPLAET